MNYKSFNLGDWIGHISGAIEDERELDGNEMRDLVEFLSGLPRWIPVTERLPEEDGRYLCTYENEFGICVDFGKFYKGDWFVGRVTAWQPLPEPYREVSE